MKEGGGSPGRRVVGSLQAEWRERERKSPSTFRGHFMDVTTGTPGEGGEGAVHYNKNRLALCVRGFHSARVIPRTQNPYFSFLFLQRGEARTRQPAAAKNPSASEFSFLFPRNEIGKTQQGLIRGQVYTVHDPTLATPAQPSLYITSEFVLSGPHTWRPVRVFLIQSSSHFTDLHAPSSSLLPRPPAPVTSKAFGTGLSPGAVGNLRSHSVIAYGAATYGPGSSSVRD